MSVQFNLTGNDCALIFKVDGEITFIHKKSEAGEYASDNMIVAGCTLVQLRSQIKKFGLDAVAENLVRIHAEVPLQ